MSTRGLYGLRKNNIDKLTYNHFDSYPSYLGKNILEFCQNTSSNDLNKFFDNTKLVNQTDPASQEIIKWALNNKIIDENPTQKIDYYHLLHSLQQNFEKYTELIKNNQTIYMTDDKEFILDSLFCEHAYIINLDTNKLEYWKGFQKEKDSNNRYGDTLDEYSNYYPAKLMYEISLDKIKKSNIEDLIEKLNKYED